MQVIEKTLAVPKTGHDPRHCIFRSVSRLARAAATSYDKALKPAGLSAGQFTTLNTLSLYGPSSVSVLAREITANPSTIPRILAPLLERGLVTSEAGEDRRVRVIRITPAGKKLLRKAQPYWQRGHSEVLARFDAPRWNRLRAEMAILRQALID